MKNKFFGLYCGYSQEDIIEIIEEVKKNKTSSIMDNYILRKTKGGYVMEDKWEAEAPKELRGDIEKIVLDALSIEYLGKESRFSSLQELTEYMVREEESDMEAYLRNEEEWEY